MKGHFGGLFLTENVERLLIGVVFQFECFAFSLLLRGCPQQYCYFLDLFFLNCLFQSFSYRLNFGLAPFSVLPNIFLKWQDMLLVKQFIQKFVQFFYAHMKELNLKLFIKKLLKCSAIFTKMKIFLFITYNMCQ